MSLGHGERAMPQTGFKQTRQRLAQGTFSTDLIAKLEKLAR